MLPDALTVKQRLDAVLIALEHEREDLRPKDSTGRPGGLVLLEPRPTLILPDLHARKWLVEAALDFVPGKENGGEREMAGESEGVGSSRSLRELLGSGEANLVFVGDGINSEGSVTTELLWRRAFKEYCQDWTVHGAMDEEMDEALGTMLLVMQLKSEYSCNVHFLKGNHDNLANRVDGGDRRFYKYAAESDMGASWFAWKYGQELLDLWRTFERSLPLVAAGDREWADGGFGISHAEPARALSREDIVEYREKPEVVYSLIWTDNDGAEPGSVAKTLAALGLGEKSLWFSGHRHVESRHGKPRQNDSLWGEDRGGEEHRGGHRHAVRAGGRLVQFHSRIHTQGVFLVPGNRFSPEKDIVDLSPGRTVPEREKP